MPKALWLVLIVLATVGFVDPQSRDVFVFQPQTVPGNVVAHTP